MITGYRILQRISSEPARVIVEIGFDGEGYCYGMDEQGNRLWRETDTWSVNVPEGEDEAKVIREHIVQWELESRLPVAQQPEAWQLVPKEA